MEPSGNDTVELEDEDASGRTTTHMATVTPIDAHADGEDQTVLKLDDDTAEMPLDGPDADATAETPIKKSGKGS